MPLYEYACRRCDTRFEALVRQDEAPGCPSCGGEELTKLMSAANVGRADAASHDVAPAGCGRCGDPRGPGACAMR